MKNIILHHHFFKNAGSTLINILQREFADGFIEYHPTAESKGHFSEDKLAILLSGENLGAVSSHHFIGQNYNLSSSLCKQYRFYDFILVRHPLMRLLSMFTYYRTLGLSDHPIVSAAQRSNLREFLEFLIRRYPNHVLSPQVCNLSGGAILPPTYQHLDEAISRLCICAICGTVDQFKAAMISAEYLLSPVFPKMRLHYAKELNVSTKIQGFDGTVQSLEDVIGRDLYSQLIDMNSLDIELCNAANFELARRISHIPHYDELTVNFDNRCTVLRSTQDS